MKIRIIKFLFPVIFGLVSTFCQAQNTKEEFIQHIFKESLSSNECMNHLDYLTKKTPGRLAGTQNADKAVKYLYKILKGYKLDTVYLQETTVARWFPGNKSLCTIIPKVGHKTQLNICPLGPSVCTPENGILSNIIEIKSFDELDEKRESISGKIVFYNRAWPDTLISPMKAYVKTVDQRVYGAIQAAKYGATAVLVRSVTSKQDDSPHTGVLRYNDTIPRIPAAVISTNDADSLSRMLNVNPELQCSLEMNCFSLPDTISYNVVAEMWGSQNPKSIILAGGHIDSWFNTEGAHDDGAGCVQAIEVLRILKTIGYAPLNTVRIVLFMDEEMNQRGGQAYFNEIKKQNVKHIAAIESDAGGDLPKGFSIDGRESFIDSLQQFTPYFKPYGNCFFIPGYGGVDIRPLKQLDIPTIGFVPDVQRYFDFHHSQNDTFEQVNKRHIQLGAAYITTLVYLLDKFPVYKNNVGNLQNSSGEFSN